MQAQVRTESGHVFRVGDVIEHPEDFLHKIEKADFIRPLRLGADSSAMPGGMDDCGPDNSGFYNPHCPINKKPLCSMTKASGSGQGLPGGTAYTIAVSPQRSTYFRAVSCRMFVCDSNDEDIARRARISRVDVNGVRREDYDTAAPVAGTLRYQSTRDYELDEPYAVAVGWGVFGWANSPYVLNVTCFPNYPAAVTLDHEITIWGDPLHQGHPEVLKMIETT